MCRSPLENASYVRYYAFVLYDQNLSYELMALENVPPDLLQGDVLLYHVLGADVDSYNYF